MTDPEPPHIGVCSHDFDGYIDDAGTIHTAGTRGWCVSTVSGDAVFNPPHRRESFRFITAENDPAPDLVVVMRPAGVC